MNVIIQYIKNLYTVRNRPGIPGRCPAKSRANNKHTFITFHLLFFFLMADVYFTLTKKI